MKSPAVRGPDQQAPRGLLGRSAIWLGVGALAAAAILLAQDRRGDSEQGRENAARTQSPEAVLARESQPASARKEETVASFRQAVLNHIAQGSASSPPPVPEDPQQPLLAMLDERLANAPQNPAEAERLQTELRAILQPGMLDGAAATLACGASMCRIDISGADDAHAQKASNVVAERLPKTFAAAAVYSKGTGERAVYAAKDGADLRPGEMDAAHAAASAK